jgi:SAM-dependent methyltransferase
VSAPAKGLGLTAKDLETSPWDWMTKFRKGKVYQPDADGDPAADPNGCIPKLALISGAGYDLRGRSLLSLGAASGLYELGLAEAAVRRGGQPAAVDLVDTDAEALETAAEKARGLGLTDFRTVRSAADEFRIERHYDVCFFLSLYHHYDRLGPTFRSRGMRVLEEIGRTCRTLFFETGQTDDTVPGSELWPRMLEMGSYPSPAHWLESRVPEITGYDGFVRLGTNPATNRHLYVFWKSHAVSVDARFDAAIEASAGADAPGVGLLALDRTAAGEIVALMEGGVRPLAEVAGTLAGGRWLLDCRFSHGAVDAAGERDSHFVGAVLSELPADSYVLLLRETGALAAIPQGVNAAFRIDAESEEDALLQLTTAAYSGFTLVAADRRWARGTLPDAARSLGVRTVFVTGG